MIRPGSATAHKHAAAAAAWRSTGSLHDELDRAYRRTADSRAWDWRERTGWPLAAAGYGLGGGVARIAFAGDTYEPCDREGVGTPALILPCWSGPAPSSPDTLLDLLAFVPSTGAVITRLGLAAMLGEWAIHKLEMGWDRDYGSLGRRLMVYRDPLSWALAGSGSTVWGYHRGGHGIVVLDWRRLRSAIGPLVDNGVELVGEDIATARRLRAALQPKAPASPRILVATPEQVAA